MTNPAKFSKKILRVDRFEKRSYFDSAILEFFFANPMKNSQRWMGRNFDDY